MSGANPWTWDPARRAYYMFNQALGLYIYEDGRRVDREGRVVTTGAGSSSTSTIPRQVQPGNTVTAQIETAGGNNQEYLANSMNRMNLNENYQYQTSQYPYQTAAPAGASSASRQNDNPHLAALRTDGPSPEITDPVLRSVNVLSRGRLRGTWKEHENLFPGFQVRKPGKKFFVRGKVFKVLWPELVGNYNNSVTVTKDDKFGEGIATKIRWFIVIKPGSRFCTCLPIQTYQSKGVAKIGVIKSQHAIAFTSKKEPAATDGERPGHGEGPMLPGIRVNANKKTDKLDQMSRIDFSRTYTVEHNVKVYDFGMVAKDYLERLVSQWIKVMFQDDLPNFNQLSGTNNSDSDDDSEEEPPTSAGAAPNDDDEEEDEADDGEEEDDDPRKSSQPQARTTSGSARRTDSDRSTKEGKSSQHSSQYRRYGY